MLLFFGCFINDFEMVGRGRCQIIAQDLSAEFSGGKNWIFFFSCRFWGCGYVLSFGNLGNGKFEGKVKHIKLGNALFEVS